MKLKFDNPVINPGLNLTVRKGLKWANCDRTFVRAVDADDRYLCDVEIVERRVKRFQDIKEHELEHEHDQDCRTKAGLKKALESAYGTIDPTEIVTLVFFRPLLTAMADESYHEAREKYDKILRELDDPDIDFILTQGEQV